MKSIRSPRWSYVLLLTSVCFPASAYVPDTIAKRYAPQPIAFQDLVLRVASIAETGAMVGGSEKATDCFRVIDGYKAKPPPRL